MEIDTKYASRLFFPAPSFVQVYFEAIANSFDAGASEIEIVVELDGGIAAEGLAVTITDNGVGFTDERFGRFRRLQEPHDRFHKGLGRLVYLQYFQEVAVTSHFSGGTRRFTFSPSFRGDSETELNTKSQPSTTTLRFSGFLKDRLRSYADIRASTLKQQIIDHFLPLLHDKRGHQELFMITIDVRTGQPNPQQEVFTEVVNITEKDIPHFTLAEIEHTAFGAFTKVRMAYSIRDVGSSARVLTAVSVDQRTVPIPLLSSKAIPAGYSATFLFYSDLFAGGSDSARQRLVLPESVSQEQVLSVLRDAVAEVLNQSLPEIRERNAQTQLHFEERYPHLVGLFDSESVGIVDREDAIKTAQWRFFEQQREVLESTNVDGDAFRKSLELSARTLLEYVLYRELIIQRLSAISADDKEETVHNLIVPRYRKFHGTHVVNDIYSNNAWILDDKFMSFRTVLSEPRMDELIAAITLEQGERVEGRPDIALIFSADPRDEAGVDVVVVEVKRKGTDDKDGLYAATQLSKRARRLVDHCPNIQRMWYFGIIDIDPEMEQLLLDTKWAPLFSKGKVFYQDYQLRRSDGLTVPAPTCLMSFDAVVNDAKARNHTFLEILKSDIRHAVEAGS
jgi:hypothetical protein